MSERFECLNALNDLDGLNGLNVLNGLNDSDGLNACVCVSDRERTDTRCRLVRNRARRFTHSNPSSLPPPTEAPG
jgi:hypothetical protein